MDDRTFRAARDQDWVHGVRFSLQNTSLGSGSGASSSDASVSSASLALGRGHAQLRPSHVAVQRRAHSRPCGHNRGSPLIAGAVRLGDTSDVDGSEGALNNSESQIPCFVGDAEAR